MKKNDKNMSDDDIQIAWEKSFQCLMNKGELSRREIFSCLLTNEFKKTSAFPSYFLKDVLTAYILNVPLESKWNVLKSNIEQAKKEVHSKFPTNEISCPNCKEEKGLPIDRSQEAWAAEILGYFVRDDSHFGDGGVTHQCTACSHKWKSKEKVDHSIFDYLSENNVEQVHQRPY